MRIHLKITNVNKQIQKLEELNKLKNVLRSKLFPHLKTNTEISIPNMYTKWFLNPVCTSIKSTVAIVTDRQKRMMI